MWENSLGKIKSKKNANPKPYDRPKSILSRVKDSVTGLLPQSSWLANLLLPNSPSEEPAQRQDQAAAGPSDTEQLASSGQSRESFIFRKPGRNQNDVQGLFASVSQQPVLTEHPSLDVPSTSQEALASSNLNDDDTHSESTSGCSSLLPHMESKQESKDKREEARERLPSQRTESLHESLMDRSTRGRKTLNLNNYSLHDNLGSTSEDKSSKINAGASSDSFYEKADESFGCSLSKRSSPQPQPSIFTSKRPRFSITSFGPTIGEARKSLLSESIVDSPFYSGRTTYGGASAYRRASLQTTVSASPYGRKRMHARPASVSTCPSTSNTSTASNVVLSSSAQRILQALEAMSTPVRDAKRIPTTSTTKSTLEDEDSSFTGFGLNRRRRPNLGPPTTKLSVGTPVAVVSRPSITKPSGPDNGIVSSTPISAQGSVGKIRSRVSAPVRETLRDSGRMRTEEEDAPELPSVPMPIGLSNLPSFSLLPAPSTSAPPAPSAPKAQPAKSLAQVEDKTSKPSTSSGRPTFTFSAPIIAVNSSPAAASTAKPCSFNFSSPLSVKPASQKEEVKKSPVAFKLADELKTNGSVLDVLGIGKPKDDVAPKAPAVPTTTATTTTAPVQGFGDKFKPPEDSWTCSICCVVNNSSKTKCVACETPKPSKEPSKPSTSFLPATSGSTTLSGFGDKFKPAEDTWSCPVCCIVNKKDKSQCAACESPRPGQPKETAAAPKPLPPITQGFGDKFKMASNQWECGVCMVRNSADDNQCKSCEEPRPGAKIASKAPVVPAFKFGLPQVNTVAEKSSADGGSASKESAAVPSFGQSTSTVADESKKSTASAGFKFGSTLESSSNPPSGGFKFGSSLAPAASAETPFKFGAALSSSTPATTGFSFGAKVDDGKKPAETKVSQDVAVPVSQESAASILSKSEKPEEENKTGSISGFKFGAESAKKEEPPAYEAPPAKKPLSFGFGAPSSSAGDVTSAPKPISTFSFGAPPAKTDAVKKDETPASTEPVPSTSSAPTLPFGSVKEAPKPAFSFGKSAEATKETSGFSFAVPTSSAASKEEPAKPSAGLFSFPPVSSASQTTSSFQPISVTSAAPSSLFAPPVTSSTPTVPATTASTSLFAFGATPSSSSTAPSSTTSAGLFTFGGSQPSAPAPAAAAAATKPGIFSFGATPASSSGTANQPALTFGSAPAAGAQTSAPTGFGAPSVTTTSAPTFSLGLTSTPVTSSSPAAPFAFGTAATAATTSASSSTFTFGSTTAAPASTPFAFSATPTSSFAFGKEPAKPAGGTPFSLPSQPAAATTTATSSSAPSSIFTFGAQPAAAAPAATSSTGSGSVPFTFGSSSTPSSTAGAAPAFGSFGSSTAKPSAPFSFNAPAPTSGTLGGASGFGDTAAKTTGLSFGATPASTPAFGSVPSNGFGGTSAPASTPFAFGGAQPAGGAAQPPVFNATPSFNFTANAPGAQPAGAQSSVFQFGSSTSSTNPPPSYNFNPPPAYTAPDQAGSGFAANLFGAASNPFDITGGGGAPKRQFRKAVRRR